MREEYLKLDFAIFLILNMKNLPTPQPPALDRLAFTLPLHFTDINSHDEAFETIRARVRMRVERGKCERAYLASSRYRENFRILLNGGSNVLVQVGAVNPANQKGGLRIEMNPAKFQIGDVEQLHREMRRIIGPIYDTLLERPMLNVVHFAVDIQNVCIRELVIRYKHGQRMTIFGKTMRGNGHIETCNYGSIKSAYQAAAYDKRQEQIHAAVMNIARFRNAGLNDDQLTDNKITQLAATHDRPETMRIEVRGKKLNGVAPWELAEQPNRFARFSFFAFDEANCNLPHWLQESTLSLCRQNGVKATLEVFKKTVYARKVSAFLRENRVEWWKPEALWTHACKELEKSGIFPVEAFKTAVRPKNSGAPSSRTYFPR